MSRAPVVGITGQIRVREGAERAGVNAAYVHSVAQAGGIPLILTPAIGEAQAAQVIMRMDALVLTGGHDIDPALYKTPPSSALSLASVS